MRDGVVKNAIIYPMISLSRIEGRQKAQTTLQDLWTVFDSRIGEEQTIDVCAITTIGLYDNIDFQSRHKKRTKCAKFYRDYRDFILTTACYRHDILPKAYSIKEWDVMMHDPVAIHRVVNAIGRLHNYYDTSPLFRSAVENMLEDKSLDPTQDNINFFLEEAAGSYLMGERVLRTSLGHESLRQNENGAVYIMYPGEVLVADLMAWNFLHGRREYSKERTFIVNSLDPENPEFVDIGNMVGFNIRPNRDNIVPLHKPKAFEAGDSTASNY